MSLAEWFVLLHVGSTAALLLVLGVVMAVQHVLERVAAGREVRATRTQAPAQHPTPRTRVVRVDPHVVDVRRTHEPRVAGATHRS